MCIGPFSVRALSTPHTDSPFSFPGAVARDFSFPAQLWDFRLDGNFSFFVEHAQGRVLVVPSAGLRPGGYPGVNADTVLLGIGGIGGWLGRREALLRDLWTQAVEGTAARLVVPIHWDDMTVPLLDEQRRPQLFPAPRYLGGLEWTMARLKSLAGTKKQVLIPPAADEVALPGRRQ
jgi:L-ascorbate metabolism protein UlaG (beta-lactamase superfamily)